MQAVGLARRGFAHRFGFAGIQQRLVARQGKGCPDTYCSDHRAFLEPVVRTATQRLQLLCRGRMAQQSGLHPAHAVIHVQVRVRALQPAVPAVPAPAASAQRNCWAPAPASGGQPGAHFAFVLRGLGGQQLIGQRILPCPLQRVLAPALGLADSALSRGDRLIRMAAKARSRPLPEPANCAATRCRYASQADSRADSSGSGASAVCVADNGDGGCAGCWACD